MSDLLERLRWATEKTTPAGSLCGEAANCIATLQHQLAEAQTALKTVVAVAGSKDDAGEEE